MIREPCRYRWAAMMHLRVLLEGPAPRRAAKIVESYGEPTHPLVIATCLRKGQGLAHLALIPQAAGTIMTLHPTRMNLFIAQ